MAHLPRLNISPQFPKLGQAEFARMVLVEHGNHAAAHVLAESFEGEFCTPPKSQGFNTKNTNVCFCCCVERRIESRELSIPSPSSLSGDFF